MATGSKATAVIVAAGSGQRLGAGGPKSLVPLAGRAMYEWSLEAVCASASIGAVVIAAPAGREADFAAPAIGPGGPAPKVVTGGETRSESVAAGLGEVETDLVVVHDAARPMLTSDLVDGAVAQLDRRPELDAVIVAAVVTDTVKRVDRDGNVVETLDRESLRAVQTPQVFRRDSLVRAMEAGDLSAVTDDATLIELAGGSVAVHPGPARNFKVTTPADLSMAELLLSGPGQDLGQGPAAAAWAPDSDR